MNKIQKEDIEQFSNNFDLVNLLKNTKILITGATGLIGSSIVYCLNSINIKYNLDIQIICLVRDLKKAQILFSDVSNISFYINDLGNKYTPIEIKDSIDYIIHTAMPTASMYFIDHPVETFLTAYEGTLKILELSTKKNIKSIVYVSSLEVYGKLINETQCTTENEQGYLNPLNERSSYPMGKRASECLCYCYYKEYNLPIKIARLTQTFGAGISEKDNRVFAQFAKSIVEKKDIILYTPGDSAKPYCYLTDAVCAIFYLLLKGKDGEAYNIANPETYISIKDLALFLKKNFAPEIDIKIQLDKTKGYPPSSQLKLSTEKLNQLGWKPKFNLYQMFHRLIKSLENKTDISS